MKPALIKVQRPAHETDLHGMLGDCEDRVELLILATSGDLDGRIGKAFATVLLSVSEDIRAVMDALEAVE